jgi:hypothetical protein
MPPHNVWRSAALLVALVLAALLVLFAAVACEPWPPVEYVNATSQRVAIYKGGEFAFSLEPHQSKNVMASEDVWRPDIKIAAEDGRVLLEDHITWDELEEMGRKIVITDPEHPPPRSPTPSPGTTPTG